MVDLSDTLVDEFDVVEFLDRLCGHSVNVFAVGAAGVMLMDHDRRLRVLAASSEEVELLELFQIQAAEGPCLDAHRTGEPTHADTADELRTRWPRFGERVAPQFESVYALPMRLRGESLGALNLYGRSPGALDADAMPLGQALADVATISLLQHRAVSDANALSSQLQHALNSRIVIEQAKGKYAERNGVSVVTAFDALRTYSQNRSRKLVDVSTAFLNDEIDIPADPN